MTPLAAILLCAVLLAKMHGCGPDARGIYQRPLTYNGVPIIRVLVTPHPVERITVSTTGEYRIEADGPPIGNLPSPLTETVITREGSIWQLNGLSVRGQQLLLTPAENSRVTAGQTTYRGKLQLLPVGETQLIAVNHLDMESYLAGVLPKELYASWSPQTYEALSVAARTFAMYHMLTFGERNDYDLGSTQAAQVYGGFSAETPKAWDAVRATHGEVLTFGGTGDERLFMAQYSASCGGYVNAADVIRNARDIPPLRGGQTCNDCASCPRFRWPPVAIAKADIHRAMQSQYPKAAAALADVRSIRVTSRKPNRRPVWVDVIASDGESIRVRAEDVRIALLRAGAAGASKLYSMNCEMRDAGEFIEFHSGKGFGHGVGICQWGAQGKAVRGMTADQILDFYYPRAKIFRSY